MYIDVLLLVLLLCCCYSSYAMQVRHKVGLLRLPLHQGLYNGTVNGKNEPHGFGSIRYLKGDRFDRFNYTGQWHEGGIANGGIIQWNNGARYEGLIGNNTMHGQGTYVWPNRDRYRGEYHKGLRNGMGEMIYYAKKEKYMGHWQDGLYHGQGQYWWANGDIYVGDWRQGRPHGHGEFKHDARGTKYVGQFDKGQKSGFGTEYYKDNSSFMGKFQNGKRVGEGVIYYKNKDGTEHERRGQWIDNDLRGPVIHHFLAENKTIIEFWNGEGFYVGERNQGKPHGQGILKYHPNDEGKAKYNGMWQKGLKHGFGTMSWKNGDLYIGNWKYDLREGQGEYRWSNGNRYHGEYHKGKPHGYGEYSSIKGDRYIGDFANGNFHGQGQFTFGTTNRTGDKYEGDFYKGEFHGNGTYVYANGDRFAGSFRFGKKNGRGVLYTHDGETIPGRWRNDKLVAELYIYPASGSIGLGQENPELRTNKNGIELEEQIDPEQQEKVTNISPPVVEST